MVVKWIIVKVHLTGDHYGHFDVKSDNFRSGNPQTSHFIQNIVFLKLLQPIDFQIWFPEQFQGFSVLGALVDRTCKTTI